MIYRSFILREVMAQLDRLQRELQQGGDRSTSIRGGGQSSFPALNVGSTAQSIHIYAFAPGVDPASLDVQIERGVLTLSGERPAPVLEGNPTVHVSERFSGRFRRVVNLPDDIDAAGVSARYRDGVLQITVPRRAAEQPRKIEIH